MRIHVVGLGAVGSFVAFHLRRTLSPKHSVIALHRKSSAPAISQNPNGPSILLTSDGVIATQDGVEHAVYHTSPSPDRHLIAAPPLATHGQSRGDHPLELNRPWDPHELRSLHGPIDSLIIATKAHAVTWALTALRNHITRDSTIVLLHNGMGVYENVVEKLFPVPADRPNFVFASNTHGLWRKDTMHAVHAGVGEIQLGIVPDPLGRDYEAVLTGSRHAAFTDLRLDDIADLSDEKTMSPRYVTLRNTISALTSARALGASWRPFHETQIAIQRKLVVNAFVNPVSALLQCRNGKVLASDHGRWVMKRLCEEAQTLYEADFEASVAEQRRAHEIQAGSERLPPFIAPPFPPSLKKFALCAEVERVVEQTKYNYSSMYRDVQLGNKTEIDYINGYLLRIARKYRINALVNESLFHLINMRSSIPLVKKAGR